MLLFSLDIVETFLGDFAYFDDNSGNYSKVASIPLSASAVDGSKVVHAANVYRFDAEIPLLDKNKDADLVYISGDNWALQVNGETIKEYKWNDLRVSIVYRARCFKSEEDLAKYRTYDEANGLTLDSIIDVFRKDLSARGVISADKNGKDGFEDGKDRLRLANLIMDTYVKYPYPSREVAVNPYNYALISNAFW